MKALYAPNGWFTSHPLDQQRNHLHRKALSTVSRFMGQHPWDYAEFLYGQLVSGHTVPF